MIQSTLWYTSARYLLLVLGFIRGILVAGWLGPVAFGTFGLMVLILRYLKYTNLGVVNAWNVEVSSDLKGDESDPRVRKLTRDVFGYHLTLAGLFSAGFAIAGLGFGGWIPPEWTAYFPALAAMAVFDQLKSLMMVYFRVFGRIRALFALELGSGVLFFVCVLVFVPIYKLPGVVGSYVITGLVALAFFIPALRRYRFRIRPQHFGRLIKAGIPLLVLNFGTDFFYSIDKVFITAFLNRADLGYYALMDTFVINTLLVLTAFAFLQYPRFLTRFRQSESAESEKQIQTDVLRFQKLYGFFLFLVAAAGFVAVGWVVRLLLPAYEETAILYRIVIMGLALDKMTYFVQTYAICRRWQPKLLMQLGGQVVLACVLNGTAVALGFGIRGIAFATLICLLVRSVMTQTLLAPDVKLSFVRDLVRTNWRCWLMTFGAGVSVLFFPSYEYAIIGLFLILYGNEIRPVFQTLKGNWMAKDAAAAAVQPLTPETEKKND